MSEDSVAADNDIDGFNKVGLSCKKHIKNLLNQHGGGSIFYKSQDIPCKAIDTFRFPKIVLKS